jgi:hypothetical protein
MLRGSKRGPPASCHLSSRGVSRPVSGRRRGPPYRPHNRQGGSASGYTPTVKTRHAAFGWVTKPDRRRRLLNNLRARSARRSDRDDHRFKAPDNHPRAVGDAGRIDTLYGWRHRGLGPAGYRIGRHVRYRRGTVEAWLARQVGTGSTRRSPVGGRDCLDQ